MNIFKNGKLVTVSVNGKKQVIASGKPTISVTSISIANKTTSLIQGNTYQLQVSILPSNATDKTLTYTSSNTAIATVSSSGLINTSAIGTCVITVKSSNNIVDTMSLTVTSATVSVTSVSLNKSTSSLVEGGTETLTATVLPTDATNKAVTWNSSNTAVATVNSTGLVTAVASGLATITATTIDGSYTSACTYTVTTAIISVTGITLNKSTTNITNGNTEQLTATVIPTNATNKNVTWSSSNTTVATVSSTGLVTGLSIGSAIITCATLDGGFNSLCTANITTSSSVDETNAITLTTTQSGTASIQLIGSGSSVIDFGNGYVTTKTLSSTALTVSTTYTDNTSKTIKIDNANNITTFDCNNLNVSSLNIDKAVKLNKLVCYGNNIDSLNFANNAEIQYIHCHNNPIVTNDANLASMISSLPSRSNMAYGSIIIDNKDQMLKVESVSIAKDWVFGSAIMYNTTEWAKCGYHFKQLGIADIWESAEQGNGVTIGLIDCGFDLSCQEFSTDSIVGVRNFSTQGAVDEVPLPTSGNTVHGNGTSSLIIAKGVSMYGVAPKTKLLLLKSSDASNVCYTNTVSNAISYAGDQNVDLISISQGFTSSNSTLQKAVKNFVALGKPFVAAVGNSGDGNATTNEYAYPAGYSEAISVGAITSANAIWSSSSSFPEVDLVSYGVSVTMQSYASSYKSGSGTSYSTPMVAGVIALLINIFIKKNGRKPTEPEIYQELIKRTVSMGIDSRLSGVGRVQLMSYNNV